MTHGQCLEGWNRRTFLKGMGLLGALTFSDLACLSQGAPAAAAATQPTRFVYAWTAFDLLDPHVKYDGNAYFFNLNMYDNLLRYQGNPPEIVPWLAERYDVTEGGRTWTFHLRRGVQFHDGNEVNAEAVRFSFERLLTLGKGPAGVFKRMGLTPERVQAIDTHTVQIQLAQPYGPFRAALPIVSIVNPAVIKAHAENGDWAEKRLVRNEAGSGAYALVKYDPATGFVMQRFPGYWRGWQAKYMDEVEIRLMRETSSRVLALMKGDIHTADTNFPPDQLEKLEKSPRLKVSAYNSMAPCYIKMHNLREPFTDIHVRKALSYAFNYESFIHDILKGRATRNPGPMPQSLWGYPRELEGYSYDLEKAKAHLAQAQVKITRPLEIHVQSEFEQTVQAALLLQSDLAKLGIELRVVKSLFPTIVASAKSPETSPDMWIHWVSTYYVDPENWLGDIYDSANWGTWKSSCFYKNSRVDELLQQARSHVEQEERAKFYEEACRLITEDAPDIWVYTRLEYPPLAKNVQGFAFCPVGTGRDFWPLYFDAQA
jgi:peptide/nickel transport system substrate-binding protein